MGLSFQKFVVMTNPRLKRLYHVSVFLTACVVAGWFIYTKQWRLKVELNDEISINLWVNAPDFERLEAAWEAAQFKPMCTSPSDYDYSYDGTYTYFNHTCLRPCSAIDVNNDRLCYAPSQSFIREDQNRVFLVSSMRSEGLSEDDPRLQGATFLPMVEALTVSFSYSFAVPGHSSHSSARGHVIDIPTYDTGNSMQDTLTVILDHNRHIWDQIRPTTKITLSVQQLLELAGSPGLLDEPQSALGKNRLEGARHMEGPAARIAGMEFVLEVDCFNSKQMDVLEDWMGEVCFVRVERKDMWASVEVAMHGFGASSFSYHQTIIYHGLRIRGKGGGHFDYTNFHAVYLNVVAAIVMLSLPKKVFLLIATRLLGRLSLIYRRVIFDKFNIGEQVGGMATRLMANSASFVELEEEDMMRGISRERMKERIRSFTEYRVKMRLRMAGASEEELNKLRLLDEHDFNALVDFAYKSVACPQWFRHYNDGRRCLAFMTRMPFFDHVVKFVQGCMGAFSTAFLEDDNPDSEDSQPMSKNSQEEYLRILRSPERLNTGMFLLAAANDEPVTFLQLMSLFDNNRNRTFLERIFTPRYLSDFINARDELLKTRGEEGGTEFSLDDLPAPTEPTSSPQNIIGVTNAKSGADEDDVKADESSILDSYSSFFKSALVASSVERKRPSLASSMSMAQEKRLRRRNSEDILQALIVKQTELSAAVETHGLIHKEIQSAQDSLRCELGKHTEIERELFQGFQAFRDLVASEFTTRLSNVEAELAALRSESQKASEKTLLSGNDSAGETLGVLSTEQLGEPDGVMWKAMTDMRMGSLFIEAWMIRF